MANSKKPPPSKRSSTSRDKEIGLRVRAMRVDQNMSQQDLAERLGVSFQQIQKYERGANRLSATRLFEVAEALHTSPLELMNWKASKQNEVMFDLEAYKLAKAWSVLPDNLKPAIRSMINTLIAATE